MSTFPSPLKSYLKPLYSQFPPIHPQAWTAVDRSSKAVTKFPTATYGAVQEQTKANMTVAEKRKTIGPKMHISGIRVSASNLTAKLLLVTLCFLLQD